MWKQIGHLECEHMDPTFLKFDSFAHRPSFRYSYWVYLNFDILMSVSSIVSLMVTLLFAERCTRQQADGIYRHK